MTQKTAAVQDLTGIVLFADLTRPQLEGIARLFEEEFFDKGQRILRQGFSGSNFYVIVDGDAEVVADGKQIATLTRGDCFGEVSILLGEPPTADVVAASPLRVLQLPAEAVKDFLMTYPTVMYRMLQGEAHRLRNTTKWQS